MRRKAGLVPSLLVALLLIPGCGGDGDDVPVPQQVVEDAFEQTVDEGTATIDLRATGVLEFSGELGADFGSDESYGTLTFERVPGIATDTEATVYVKGTENFARYEGLVPGDPWVRLPDDPVSNLSSSPTVSLTLVRDTLTDVREESSGGAGTKYAATYDLAEVAELVPPEQREDAEATLAELEVEKVPARITVDPDGYVSGLELDLSPTLPKQAEFLVSMEFSRFGAPVLIEPPPDDEVITMEELQGG